MVDLSVSAATAAPARLRFKDADYVFSPLRHGDWGEFEKWMQSVEMQNGLKLIRDLNGECDDDEKKEMRKLVFEKALNTRLGTQSFLEACSTIPGVTMIAWLRLRQNHPEITLDQVTALMMDNEFQDMVDAAEELLDSPAAGSGSVAGKPRTRSKNKTRKRKKKGKSR